MSSYEYKESKELFNAVKDSQINFDDVVKSQNELLSKISNVKMGKKTDNHKKVINNLNNFYILEKKLLIFLETMEKWFLIQPTNQNKMKLREKDLLTPKQMLQRLPISLAQVKAGNNSGSLLNEIRQIVYSLYQSKQITKKIYNNISQYSKIINNKCCIYKQCILYL